MNVLRWGAAYRSASMFFHVVAHEQVGVANVELAVGDDGVRPGGVIASGRLEPAVLHVLLWVGLDEGDRPAFVTVVEPAVGIGDGALAGPSVLPHDLARLELDAVEPAAALAVEVAVHEHHAAVVILHL